MSETVRVDCDRVARITINRPTVGNALDIPTARRLMEVTIACEEDPEIRCVVLTGAGRLFCAGGDVAAFNDAGENPPTFLKKITSFFVEASLLSHARLTAEKEWQPSLRAAPHSSRGATEHLRLEFSGDSALPFPSGPLAT